MENSRLGFPLEFHAERYALFHIKGFLRIKTLDSFGSGDVTVLSACPSRRLRFRSFSLVQLLFLGSVCQCQSFRFGFSYKLDQLSFSTVKCKNFLPVLSKIYIYIWLDLFMDHRDNNGEFVSFVEWSVLTEIQELITVKDISN